MALVVMDGGDVALLKIIFGQRDQGVFVYHLFENDHAPAKQDLLTAYKEVTQAGYVPQTIFPPDWTIAILATDGAGATSPAISYSLGGGGQVFGYYVTDLAGTQLFWAEAFPLGPFITRPPGGILIIDPAFSGW